MLILSWKQANMKLSNIITSRNLHLKRMQRYATLTSTLLLLRTSVKGVHSAQEKLNCEIDSTFEDLVEKLKERKRVLKNEIGHKLGKPKTTLGDVEKPIRKQIDEIKKVLDLVKDGLNFPLHTEALTSHKAMCQQLEGLLNRIRPDEELPRRTAEEGETIGFRSQGSDELSVGPANT